MHENTDFGQLYDALGIRPGCSIAELRLAYRRQAAQLHPDAGGTGADVARLQQINRIYHSATRFHRMHGRLPGETAACFASADAVDDDARAAAPDMPHAQATLPIACAPMADPRRKMRSLMLAGVVIALLAWVVAPAEEAPQRLAGSQDNFHVMPGAGVAKARRQHTQRVAIGMTPARVMAISGPPLSRHESRWDYGPSWIAFDCGLVSDWYSSPLRPLHPGPASPVKRDQVRARADC